MEGRWLACGCPCIRRIDGLRAALFAANRAEVAGGVAGQVNTFHPVMRKKAGGK